MMRASVKVLCLMIGLMATAARSDVVCDPNCHGVASNGCDEDGNCGLDPHGPTVAEGGQVDWGGDSGRCSNDYDCAGGAVCGNGNRCQWSGSATSYNRCLSDADCASGRCSLAWEFSTWHGVCY